MIIPTCFLAKRTVIVNTMEMFNCLRNMALSERNVNISVLMLLNTYGYYCILLIFIYLLILSSIICFGCSNRLFQPLPLRPRHCLCYIVVGQSLRCDKNLYDIPRPYFYFIVFFQIH